MELKDRAIKLLSLVKHNDRNMINELIERIDKIKLEGIPLYEVSAAHTEVARIDKILRNYEELYIPRASLPAPKFLCITQGQSFTDDQIKKIMKLVLDKNI